MLAVRISRTAAAELRDITDYIAVDNRKRAASFARELLERCTALASYPERYSVYAEIDGRRIRRAPYGRYLIFYSAREDELEVHHIVHSVRDYVRILFPEA